MSDRVTDDDPWVVPETVGAGVVVLGILIATPYAALIVGAGSPADLGIADALVGTVRVAIDGRWGDPRQAYPLPVANAMPGPAVWWGCAFVVAAALSTVAALVWRRIDVHVSRTSVARRPYDARGSRRRTWARPRDLQGTIARTRQPGRFTLGRLDGRLILSAPETHVALVAPTRSGKTSRFVIPWLLEHQGPAVVTSTKLDVVSATAELRGRVGRVWIWDPFGKRSASWSPLHGCEHWSYALAQGQWIADASGEGESAIAAYWQGEAAKLLAPLLHAAALDGASMRTVLSWVDEQEVDGPGKVLAEAGREDAKRQLDAVTKLDPRNRGTTYMSAGSILAAYRYPELERPQSAEQMFTLEEFFNGGGHTLYVVAGARHQRLLAPLVVGLISALLHEAAERARRDEPLAATLRLLLDETANIAPLRDLPAHLSQSAGSGVRIATVWQSLAQIHERYRFAADSVLANSTIKLFMGPVTDEQTRRYVQGLVGEEPVPMRSHTQRSALSGGDGGSRTRSYVMRPAASASELQQLTADRALLVQGSDKPALVSTRAWWRDRDLLRTAREMR